MPFDHADALPIGGFDGLVGWVPRRIGNYRVKRLIASGGMGAVFEAVQDQPRRAVALKVMKPGLSSRSALRRFEYEAQVLARLRHAGIAQIFEAGTHEEGELSGKEPIPFFVMEYIPNARPINEYVAIHDLNLEARLELFIKVCEAVNHGHTKGIIHRDLKPTNILVDSAGNPKVIDFGVARATDSDMAVTTLQTDVGQLVGTLQWMSPEQVDADPHDLDTRSDVYSLGVVLYELLTGKLPYDILHAPVYEAARIVREQSPARPSSLTYLVKGDLETICLKALEKDRNRRYRSAAELADDVRRYLNNEPITARAASALHELRMLARRNRPLFVSMVTIAAVLIASTLSLLVLLRGARAAEKGAQAQSKRANMAVGLLGGIIGLDEAAVSSNPEAVRDQIDRLRAQLGQGADIPEGTIAEIHADLARLYLRLGDLPVAAQSATAAEAVFRKRDERSLAPRHALMHTILGLHARTDGRDAGSAFASAYALRPQDWAVINNRAVVAAEAGDFRTAITSLRALLQQHRAAGTDAPQTRAVAENLVVVLCAADQWLEAERLLLEHDLSIPRPESRQQPWTFSAPLQAFAACRVPISDASPCASPANAADAALLKPLLKQPVLVPRAALERFEMTMTGLRQSRTSEVWDDLARWRGVYEAESVGPVNLPPFREYIREASRVGPAQAYLDRVADAADALLLLPIPRTLVNPALDALLREAVPGSGLSETDLWTLARRTNMDIRPVLAAWPILLHGGQSPGVAELESGLDQLPATSPTRIAALPVIAAGLLRGRPNGSAEALPRLQAALRTTIETYHGGTRDLLCLCALAQHHSDRLGARNRVEAAWNDCTSSTQQLIRTGAVSDGEAGYENDFLRVFAEAQKATGFQPPAPPLYAESFSSRSAPGSPPR